MIPGFPRPEPDAERLFQVLFRKGEPERVPLFEIHIDNEMKEVVLGERLVPRDPEDPASVRAHLLQQIRFWHDAGYDAVPWFLSLGYSAARRVGDDTAGLSRGRRGWREETLSFLRSEEDLESYPWPDPETFNFGEFEFIAENLPPGMVILPVSCGVLEFLCDIMGTENLFVSMHESPGLVDSVGRRITDHLVRCYRKLLTLDPVKILCVGDDWGHKRGVFVAPDLIRQHFLPVVREVCRLSHEAGRAFVFHSCGEMHAMMDTLIDEVGIDGKHSFEEEALPVSDFKRLYGDRVATLGGVDVDRLSRWEEKELRGYVRSILETCSPGGGFAIGSGNSVTNYTPVENYRAMMEEIWDWNRLTRG